MSKLKQASISTGWIILLILPAILLQTFAQSPIVISVSTNLQSNLIIFVPTVIILKAIGIIYPPMPGIAFTLASVPLVGWELAYLMDLVGNLIGVTCAFYLGKKYGYPILERVLGKNITQKIRETNLKRQNQIEAAVVLRFAAGGILSDGLVWGASLIGFRYTPFMTGYVISNIITTLPVFYLVGVTISLSSWTFIGIATVIAWLIIFKLKGRYFE